MSSSPKLNTQSSSEGDSEYLPTPSSSEDSMFSQSQSSSSEASVISTPEFSSFCMENHRVLEMMYSRVRFAFISDFLPGTANLPDFFVRFCEFVYDVYIDAL